MICFCFFGLKEKFCVKILNFEDTFFEYFWKVFIVFFSTIWYFLERTLKVWTKYEGGGEFLVYYKNLNPCILYLRRLMRQILPRYLQFMYLKLFKLN